MNRIFLKAFAIVVSSFCFAFVNQISSQIPVSEEKREQLNRTIVENSFDSLRNLGKGGGDFRLAEKDRLIFIKHREFLGIQDDISKIQVPNEYWEHFRDFLREDNTGLAKIFPFNQGCVFGTVVSAEELESCSNFPTFPGGGSFYSFRNHSNLEFGESWADIQFRDWNFIVGRKYNFGLINEVIGTEIEDLTKNSKVVQELSNYKAFKRSENTAEEKKEISSGKIQSLFISIPVLNKSVYVLRSVAYRGSQFDAFDKRVDLFAAFKVVGRDRDGALILLWKILKTKEAPKIMID